MKITINNVTIAMPKDAVAYKYADPLSDACWLYSQGEVEEIEKEDAGLIVYPDESN